MTNVQAGTTIQYRPATQADAEQCARVYNEGWILAFSESGLISQDIIKRANDTRLETLQRTLPTNGGPDVTGSILIVAVATVDSKDQVVGVCGLGPSREPDDVQGYPLELLNMYIDAKFHGLGIGPKMVKEGVRALGWTEKDGKMFCRVFGRNLRAMRFYMKLGGIPVKTEMTTKYGNGLEELVTMGWESVNQIVI